MSWTAEPAREARGRRTRAVLVLLVGLTVALGTASAAGPAWADHCDPNNDPGCGPHPPDPPPPVDPPCNGSVGPIHAWPCAPDQTMDCAQAATSPSPCSAVQVTVYPTTVGPVTVNGASTAPVPIPVPNTWEATAGARTVPDKTICMVNGGTLRTCFNFIGP